MDIKRCVNCMEDLQEVSGYVCPYCGFNNSGREGSQPPYAMRWNIILHGRYLIGNVLGKGGFGITYIGYDLVLNIKVAIKEYFPMDAAQRDNNSSQLLWHTGKSNSEQLRQGYQDFQKEAQKIAKIDKISSIVRVRDTFLDNDTAYIVMDFVEGVTLKDKVQKSGTMNAAECIELLTPMMEDLAQVHKMGIIHRDISPDNIVIQPDGSIKLLDLGAAMDLSSGSDLQTGLVAKKGFSPPEQYTGSGQIGSWTDVYALCATIFYCVTGKMIPSALDRMDGKEIEITPTIKKAIPFITLKALQAGLNLDTKKRTQTVDELLRRIKVKKPKPWIKKAVGIAAAIFIGIPVLTGFIGSLFGNEETDAGSVDTDEDAVNDEDGMLEEDSTVTVVQLGNSNANVHNNSIFARIPDEYEYYTGGDGALYLCKYDAEDEGFYIEDDTKICDNGGYLLVGDEQVYFMDLETESGGGGICRMEKDGSNITILYEFDKDSKVEDLQYAEFSDEREYLYYLVEKEDYYGVSFYDLCRYDLISGEEELLIDDKNILWYNLYGDSIYYTEFVEDDDNLYSRLVQTGLDGDGTAILNEDKRLMRGFVEEDTLFLFSADEETFLAFDLDGTYKNGFYDMKLSSGAVGYSDGWIYYSDMSEQTMHRVRTNGTGDEVVLDGYAASNIIDQGDSWLWFMGFAGTGTEHQYIKQPYTIYGRDGSDLMGFLDPVFIWDLSSESESSFNYTDAADGTGVVITGYTGVKTSFKIPEKIDGKMVVEIGSEAFEETDVEEIGLPAGVKSIGEDAFAQCQNLSFIGLPEGLEVINSWAFLGCDSLIKVNFPNSLIRIEKGAFWNTELSEVYIPAGVEYIGDGAFAVSYDAGLQEFVVDEDNPLYFTYGGVLFTEDSDSRFVLLACPVGMSDSYTVPIGAEVIESYAFADCRDLTELIVYDDLYINENAFYYAGVTDVFVESDCVIDGTIPEEWTIHY